MMTKLEVALFGLLIVLVFLVGHELATAFLSNSEANSVARRAPEVTSTAIVQSPEVRPALVRHTSVPVRRRVEPADEPTHSYGQSYLAYRTEVADPVILAAPPEGLLTTEIQATAFDNLRQQFLEAMTSDTIDPASAEYRRRWQEQQELMDEQFEALFGVEAFNQQQNAAILAAINNN